MQRFPLRAWLLILTFLLLGMSAIGAPLGRDFVFQHIPTLAGVGMLAWLGVRRPLGNTSYVLIFIFVGLHILGGRYFYSFVPYDDWTNALFGFRLNDVFGWERNHYDRFVHLMGGVLLFHPMREISMRLFRVIGWRSYLVALMMHSSISGLYELLEGLVALSLDPAAAESYNGQQGDMWDAQKDMALALAGTIAAAGSEALVSWRVLTSTAGAPR